MDEPTASPGRVLLAAARPELAGELAAVVDDMGLDAHVVETAEEGLDRLLEHSYLCLLASEDLPDRRGTEMIEAVIRAGAALPCVLVAGRTDGDDVLASEATAVIRHGAHDWEVELRRVLARFASPRSGTMWKLRAGAPVDAREG